MVIIDVKTGELGAGYIPRTDRAVNRQSPEERVSTSPWRISPTRQGLCKVAVINFWQQPVIPAKAGIQSPLP